MTRCKMHANLTVQCHILHCVRQYGWCLAAAEKTATEATLEEQEMAATKIQALFRGIHDREKVKAMKQEQVLLMLISEN